MSPHASRYICLWLTKEERRDEDATSSAQNCAQYLALSQNLEKESVAYLSVFTAYVLFSSIQSPTSLNFVSGLYV